MLNNTLFFHHKQWREAENGLVESVVIKFSEKRVIITFILKKDGVEKFAYLELDEFPQEFDPYDYIGNKVYSSIIGMNNEIDVEFDNGSWVTFTVPNHLRGSMIC